MRKLKNIVKRIALVYVAIAIPFTLLYWLRDTLRGNSSGLESYLWLSVVACLAFSLFFMNWLPLKKLFDSNAYDDESNEKLASSRTKQILSSSSKEDLLQKLKSSQYFAKAKIIEVGGKIRVITGATFKSWGEIINIHISESDTNNQFRIVSIPKQQLTILDYGKNKKNIEQIEDMLLSNA